MRGKLITFEGPDGSGKTSNMSLLAKHLTDRGYKVVVTREPGGTPLGEELRKLILDPQWAMDVMTEALLFAAGRREHVVKKIWPLLEKGYVVISDRFLDSSYAHQLSAKGQEKLVLDVHKHILGGFEPDYTLFFDIPLEESTRRLEERRAAQGEIHRFNEADLEYKAKVYAGYQQQLRLNQHRMVRIDALPALDVVNESVIRWANSVFPYAGA